MADGNTDGLGGPGATGNPDETRKKEVERAVLELFDANADGFLSVWEWEEGLKAGKRLPDFGVSFASGVLLYGEWCGLTCGCCGGFSMGRDIMATMSTSMRYTIMNGMLPRLPVARPIFA